MASSSEPPRRRRAALHGRWRTAGAGVLLAALAAPLRAQATVAGQLTVLERPGATGADLAAAVVYLEPVGETAALVRAGPPPTAPETIAMRGREFIPHVRVVRVGGSVAFPNQDPFSHNVFSNSALGAFDLGLYRRGSSRAATFERPGVYAIYCNIHHRMSSFVVAIPTAYAARPGADGRFAIRGVPPGTYVLHVWHERAPEVAQRIAVSGAAPELRIALDAREYVPSPHLNKFGLPYAVTRADRY